MSLGGGAADAEVPAPYSAEDVVHRAARRLSLELPDGTLDGRNLDDWGGDYAISKKQVPEEAAAKAHLAAVLIPVVAHREEATVLLTKRSSHLRKHPGQIAFPGGRIDPEDANPIEAALREAMEEVGLDRRHIQPIGYLDPYLTGTNFRVLPVVAVVTPPFDLALNPDEVDFAFEVPLAFLMEPDNHVRRRRDFPGAHGWYFYEIVFREHKIWGATAGMLRNFYERLYT